MTAGPPGCRSHGSRGGGGGNDRIWRGSQPTPHACWLLSTESPLIVGCTGNKKNLGEFSDICITEMIEGNNRTVEIGSPRLRRLPI